MTALAQGNPRRRSARFAAIRSSPRRSCSTLALGLGVNAAAFSMLDALVFRPFSLPESIGSRSSPNGARTTRRRTIRTSRSSPANFIDWRQHSRVVRAARRVRLVAGQFLGRRRARARAGLPRLRRLLPDVETDAAAGPLHRRGGRRPTAAQGRRDRLRALAAALRARGPTSSARHVKIDGEYYDVIGVAPAGFDFPTGAAVWGPLDAGPAALQDRRNRAISRSSGGSPPGRTLDRRAARR